MATGRQVFLYTYGNCMCRFFHLTCGLRKFTMGRYINFLSFRKKLLDRKLKHMIATAGKLGFKIDKMFKCYTTAELEFKDDIEWDYDIQDIINDKEVISGQKGAFEIFFKR